MKMVKKLPLVLFASTIVIAALTTSSALALELPDMHVLSGETYPVTGEGTVKGEEIAVMETELGEKVVADEWETSLTIKELTSLGLMTMDFRNAKEPKTKTACNTLGDAEGVILIPGEFHLVIVNQSPLTAAILFLFTEFTIECNKGKIKIKVRSPAIFGLAKVTAGVDTEKFGLVLKCSKGKQELKEYFNDEGKSTKGVLTMNFGLGFETACMQSTAELVVSLSKMVDFLF